VSDKDKPDGKPDRVDPRDKIDVKPEWKKFSEEQRKAPKPPPKPDKK
jgi:hypothetical protein